MGEQYRDDANLRARIELHSRFGTNPYPWPRWVFDRLRLAPGERVLEVGCGTAELWRANLDRIPDCGLTLADLSPGMLEAAQSAVGDRAELVVADVQGLPFEDGAFDLAVANHMLYHVDDRPRALRELARVLGQGGRLVAATNGASHLRELDGLAGPQERPGMRGFTRFGLENGPAQVAEAGFEDVRVEIYDEDLEVTETAPVVVYLRSMLRDFDADAVPSIEQALQEAIARDGSFHVTKSQGLVLARRP